MPFQIECNPTSSGPAMKERVLIAIIGIIPASLGAVLGYFQGISHTEYNQAKYELDNKSLQIKNDQNPNFRRLSYPNYGISLNVPVAWIIEDAPAILAGGEFNLISRFEASKAAIGMNFRLRPVQRNYIADIQSQIKNQMEVYKKIDENAAVSDVSISALQGKMFAYKQKTGERLMDIKVYFIRLVPNVQMQITAAQYDDAGDKDQFWREADGVISSIVIATDSWQESYKNHYLTK